VVNKRIRKLFEEHTVPNFGYELSTARNKSGEYVNPALEDHWQTFQEAAELIVKECIFLNMNELTHIENEILIPAYEKHFGNLYPKP